MPTDYRAAGRLLFLFRGVNGLAEDEESVIEKFGDEIGYHAYGKHEVFVPADGGEGVAAPGGQGSEYQIEAGHLQHGNGDVARGAEGYIAVKGEIPQHGEDKSCEIADPVVPAEDLVHQRESKDLDYAGAGRKQSEFYSAGKFFFAVHLASPFGGKYKRMIYSASGKIKTKIKCCAEYVKTAAA